MLTAESIRLIARASFERYKTHRRHDGLPVEYEAYESQPETLIRSGLEQARDIERKVSLLGYEIVPRKTAGDRAVIGSLSDDQVETLARAEHRRWVDERVEDGWSFATEKDVDRKTSPYLVPWNDLSEQVREYDREPVRNILPLLSEAGFVICPPVDVSE